MKRIFIRLLLCLCLFVLLFVHFFSNCSVASELDNIDYSVSAQADENTEDDEDKKQDGLVGKIISAFTTPLEKLGDFIVNGIIGGILDALKSLFIPDNDYFSNYFNELNSFFGDRFGFLYYPFELIIKILNNFMDIGEYDTAKEPFQLQVNNKYSNYISSADDTYTVTKNYVYVGDVGKFKNFVSCDLKKGQTLNYSFTLLNYPDSHISCYVHLFVNNSDKFNESSSIHSNFSVDYSALETHQEIKRSFTATEDCQVRIDCSIFWLNTSFKFSAEIDEPIPQPGIFAYPDIREPYTGEILIPASTVNLNDTFKVAEFKNIYDLYLMIVDCIIAFCLILLAMKKFNEVVR